MYYVRELSDPTNPSVAGLAASNPGPIQIAPVNFDALNGLNTGLAAVNPTPKDFTGKAMVVDFTGSGEGVILASSPIEIPAGGSASRFSLTNGRVGKVPRMVISRSCSSATLPSAWPPSRLRTVFRSAASLA